MKTLLMALSLMLCSMCLFAKDPKVNEVVMSVFNRSYANAQNIKWSEEDDKYYVYFTKDNMSFRMYYDKEGNVVSASKYYTDENVLPPMILNRIRKDYPDYKINSTTEVNSESGIEYYPVLINEKHTIMLKLNSSGSATVLHKYDVTG